jgi:hypothetical protein
MLKFKIWMNFFPFQALPNVKGISTSVLPPAAAVCCRPSSRERVCAATHVPWRNSEDEEGGVGRGGGGGGRGGEDDEEDEKAEETEKVFDFFAMHEEKWGFARM